ncbi:MAG: UDP-N-acetylmuramate dehydrogenase [Mariprofundaceae bacterium]
MVDWENTLSTLGAFHSNEPMRLHTTLVVGGPARWFFRPKNREALMQAMLLLPDDIVVLPMGRGSNMVVADAGFDGLVVDLSDLNQLRNDGTTIYAGAGTRMGKLSQFSATHGLCGVEFMATVPGDVGGGVAMNAGAFGQQVSDTLHSVDIVDRQGESTTLSAADLAMRYRAASLPTQSLVIETVFKLASDDCESIRQRMRAMRAKRGSTQPLALPNCGSVFKNPPNDHAARLIEAAGLKGYRQGGASISTQHANFIVNDKGATSADILFLILHVQKEVLNQFSVQLEPEVCLVGVW